MYVVGPRLSLLVLTNKRFGAALRTSNGATQAAAHPVGASGLFVVNSFPYTHTNTRSCTYVFFGQLLVLCDVCLFVDD